MIYRLREPWVAAVIGIALAAAAVAAFFLLKDGDDGPEPTGGAEAASLDQLRSVADSADFPVYWAGRRRGKEYELTITDGGNIYVRYLDPDTPIGSQDVTALTIGTYPVSDAYGALQGIAEERGAITGETPDGGIVVTNKSNRESVYIAYPGTNEQIEVYDPSAKAARKLATSGAVEPIS